MNESSSILDLRETVLPEPVSMAPQTWGWFVLGAALLALAAVAAWRWHRQHRANRYRRAALRALPDCRDTEAVATLVKRVCLSAFPRARVASLSGEAWLGFLDSTVDGSPFTQGPGRALADHYASPVATTPELIAAIEQWIRRHDARA